MAQVRRTHRHGALLRGRTHRHGALLRGRAREQSALDWAGLGWDECASPGHTAQRSSLCAAPRQPAWLAAFGIAACAPCTNSMLHTRPPNPVCAPPPVFLILGSTTGSPMPVLCLARYKFCATKCVPPPAPAPAFPRHHQPTNHPTTHPTTPPPSTANCCKPLVTIQMSSVSGGGSTQACVHEIIVSLQWGTHYGASTASRSLAQSNQPKALQAGCTAARSPPSRPRPRAGAAAGAASTGHP